MTDRMEKISFKSAGKGMLGYVRRPAGKPPFPAVLMFHGGVTDAQENTLKMANGKEAEKFLQEGFLILSADWRTLQNSDEPSRLRQSDAREAYLYLKGMKEVKADEIVCYGHSAGATTAVWTAIQTDVKATVEVAGILDYRIYAHYGISTQKKFIIDILFPSLGADYKVGRRYKKASPIHFVDQIQSPLLIIHGDEDQVVPIEQAYLFEEALKKFHKSYQLMTIANGGHRVNNFSKNIERMVLFLKKCLKKN